MIKRRAVWTSLVLLFISTMSLSCQSSQAPSPSLPTTEPVAMIWDDDGSIDGVTALLYFLEHPSYTVRAATISPGIAHPQVFAPKLNAFLEMQGGEGIPVAAGPEQPLSGDNAFPSDWRRASDRFWDVDLPDVHTPADERSAAELIIDVLHDSDEQLILFVSGPLTNLAEAFRLDPSIKGRIRSIEIMGGALEVGGNVGSLSPSAEWNIYVDPVAASEVFASGVEIRLTPLDATDKILWTEADAASWSASNRPAGSMAAQLLRHTMEDWSSNSVLIWDLVAALNVADRGLCRWDRVHIEVVERDSMNQGQTVIDDQKPPNTEACVSPDVGAYGASAEIVFSGNW